jgi:hypothetical protein
MLRLVKVSEMLVTAPVIPLTAFEEPTELLTVPLREEIPPPVHVVTGGLPVGLPQEAFARAGTSSNAAVKASVIRLIFRRALRSGISERVTYDMLETSHPGMGKLWGHP